MTDRKYWFPSHHISRRGYRRQRWRIAQWLRLMTYSLEGR